jgi:alpha-beta hydrolase superfamily lysophospholipase
VKASTFSRKDAEGIKLFVRRGEPDSGKPKAAVHMAHGVAEHSGRCEWTAERLCDAGYACYADDYRGHGNTAPNAGGLADKLVFQGYSKPYEPSPAGVSWMDERSVRVGAAA